MEREQEKEPEVEREHEREVLTGIETKTGVSPPAPPRTPGSPQRSSREASSHIPRGEQPVGRWPWGGAVVAGGGGVRPALEQRPRHPPTAEVAGQRQRRAPAAIALVGEGSGAGVAEQQAHDLEVASRRRGRQGCPAPGGGGGGVGPPLQQEPHHGGAAPVARPPLGRFA
jgi:hypothetical protein